MNSIHLYTFTMCLQQNLCKRANVLRENFHVTFKVVPPLFKLSIPLTRM